ncbi:MAG: hypothetical protein ACRELY_18940, partial [Polyangiaceae bacterium]
MRIRDRAFAIGAAISFVAMPAFAASDAGAPAKAKGDAGAPHALLADGGVIPAQGNLPAGHPAIADDQADDEQGDDGDQEQGEPPANPHANANPHGGGSGSAGMPGVFQPPADESNEDVKLPKGTIAIDIRDADDKPIPKVSVTL